MDSRLPKPVINQLAEELKTTSSLKALGNSVNAPMLNCIIFLSLSRLPNMMVQNLSVPLAFVALLHLANEKVSVGFF